MNNMIHHPDTYIDSLPYSGDIKIIIHQIARFRLAGRRAQMSWAYLCRSIGTSHTTLAKIIKSEKFLQVIKKIRRGKKQTNLYYLQPWLWSRLTKGRVTPHVKDPQGTEQLPASRPPSKLLELFRAELGKIAAPIP
jgi:hypothetical protein